MRLVGEFGDHPEKGVRELRSQNDLSKGPSQGARQVRFRYCSKLSLENGSRRVLSGGFSRLEVCAHGRRVAGRRWHGAAESGGPHIFHGSLVRQNTGSLKVNMLSCPNLLLIHYMTSSNPSQLVVVTTLLHST